MSDLSDLIPEALLETLSSANESDRNGEKANVVDALFFVGRAGFAIADAIKLLGNADAGTPMGAMEALGQVQKDGSQSISASLDAIAGALSEIAIKDFGR